MTLRMADGPVANLPTGMDAYAGYVDKGGIGITYPGVVGRFPNALHLSISIHGAPALCGDVEKGALSSWKGYTYGYCAVSNVNSLIRDYGRPHKLWTAHYDPKYGAHICSPHCWPDLVTTADGTQWTDHGGKWDESLLAADFFGAPPAPAPPATEKENNMIAFDPVTKGVWIVRSNGDTYAFDGAPYLGPAPHFLTQWGIGTAANPVVGITSDGQGGYFLAADSGGPQPAPYHITADGQYAK